MPDLHTAEHEDFRKTARTFFEREVVPFHDQWEQEGIVPRELWRTAGEASEGFIQLMMNLPRSV